MKDHPLVLLEPCLYLIVMAGAYREQSLEGWDWLAFPMVFVMRGFYLCYYARKKWKRKFTNSEMYMDTKKYYWNPHIHWTQKLSILQQRTGVFTLLTSYTLLTMAFVGFVWILLKHR